MNLRPSGAAEIELSVKDGNPEINVQVDRDKMAALGLNLQTVGLTMQTAFSGNTDGRGKILLLHIRHNS